MNTPLSSLNKVYAANGGNSSNESLREESEDSTDSNIYVKGIVG